MSLHSFLVRQSVAKAVHARQLSCCLQIPGATSGLGNLLQVGQSCRLPQTLHAMGSHGQSMADTAPDTHDAALKHDPAGWPLVSSGIRREWQREDLNVVLIHPQIPQNAGNVARTCAATGIALHLVGPMGFEIDDTKLKRAGLDYWEWVAVKVWPSFAEFYDFFARLPDPKRLLAFSKLGQRHYASEGQYQAGDWLMFGAETTGLPADAHQAARDTGGGIVKIPMSNYDHVRSLNLATSVGIGVFEALRQLDGAVLPEENS